MRSYTQLTRDERYQIYALRKAGHSQKEIAEVLGRSPSTINRELRRNRGLKGYRPEQAHRLAQNRKKERDRTRIPKSTWARVEQLLREDWSPEQISGWLTREECVSVSHERIYQHVYEDKRRGGDLHRHLRCQKPRRKRYGHYDRRGQIRERVSIDERPEVVKARSRIGDWEADTVIGKPGGAVLVTLVERRPRLSLIALAPNKTAEAVKAAILKVLQPLSAQVHTLTYDNGKEFAYHRCPPWRAKRRRVVPGSREATRDTRRAEGAKGDPKGASERGVQSYGRPVCSRNELAMLWRNAG